MLDRVIPARKEASIPLLLILIYAGRERKEGREGEGGGSGSGVVAGRNNPPPLGRGETGGEPIIKLFRPRLTLGRGG